MKRQPYDTDLTDVEGEVIEPLIPRRSPELDPSAQCGHYRQSIDENHRKRGPRGYAAAKKVTGRKRHILVDTRGLVLAVLVHAGDLQDRHGAKVLLTKARACLPRLKRIWADAAYTGQLADWVRSRCRWILQIVRRLARVATS